LLVPVSGGLAAVMITCGGCNRGLSGTTVKDARNPDQPRYVYREREVPVVQSAQERNGMRPSSIQPVPMGTAVKIDATNA